VSGRGTIEYRDARRREVLRVLERGAARYKESIATSGVVEEIAGASTAERRRYKEESITTLRVVRVAGARRGAARYKREYPRPLRVVRSCGVLDAERRVQREYRRRSAS